jgi:hypothetical protein
MLKVTATADGAPFEALNVRVAPGHAPRTRRALMTSPRAGCGSIAWKDARHR